MIIWRDGSFLDSAGAISCEDRGWLIGDAVFETILVERGHPAFVSAHLARLSTGLSIIRLGIAPDESVLRSVAAGLAAKNGCHGRSALRLTLSRVGGGRGLTQDSSATVQATATLKSVGAPAAAWRAIVSSRRRWTGSSTNRFKCVGAYAENMLARTDAAAQGADEAVMLNEHGRVACASSANLFVESGGELATPSLEEGSLPGIVRALVIEEAARMGVNVAEGPVTLSALHAGKAFLTNSIAGIVPVSLRPDRQALQTDIMSMLASRYENLLVHEFASPVDGEPR